MPEIVVSKRARKDLVDIRRYIAEELSNPDAARRIISLLKKSILSLPAFPWKGKPLDTLLGVHTEYRYLVCENYCILYVVSGETVAVVRILHQRQDCLRALFLRE